MQSTTGTIAFGGTLSVSISGSWTPVAGTTYDLFDWNGTPTGTFSSISLPALPSGLKWHDYGSGVLFDYATGQLKIEANNTYATWIGANGPATGFTTDSDNDGLPNGVENVLGSNPNTFNAGLTEVSSTATSVTFKHQLNPTKASDVTYSYQWSTDLGLTDDWTEVAVDLYLNPPTTIFYQLTPPTPPKNFLRLRVVGN